jgi:ribonuclease HII
MTDENQKTIIGIDEAGRGPLAGPVYVGLAQIGPEANLQQIDVLDDSKQMSETGREHVFAKLQEERFDGVESVYAYTASNVIDKVGINRAIQRALNRGLRKLQPCTSRTKVLLDGGLRAPAKYNQQTITKGDQKRKEISLASVLAKVARDNHMRCLDGNYANFSFGQHKGYGTKQHRENIQMHGSTDVHRTTFVSNIIN